ncbi:MAG: zinc-ribbon domain-containing protein [Rubrobacteraceae bacterium]|nr:zinc-ribbon domain-containing protein [Rubrobacter sp.]
MAERAVYCVSCGSMVKAGDRFCGVCGSAVSPTDAPSP